MAGPIAEGTPSERWLARASLTLAGLAVVIAGVFAGLRSVAMLAVGLAVAAVSLAAGFFFLSRRGWRRALSVWVARNRPDVAPPKPPLNWVRLRHLAAPGKRRLRRSNSLSRGA